MIRILFYVAVILALGLAFAWLADRPGEMILVWQGQRLETTMLVALTGLVLLIVAAVLLVWFVRALVTSPDSLKRYFTHRRRDRGYQALSSGLIAAGAGDARLARRMMQRARSLLDAEREPLLHVLEAQTYMIEGNHDEARAKFESMAEEPETRALGLRGLYLEARRLGASDAAQHYAERASEKAPQLPWAAQAALEYRTRDGHWDEAIRMLEKQRSMRLIEKAEFDRKRAVLLTARARSVLETDPRTASADAQEAIRLAPNLVPAAVTAAKALFRLNDLRRGSKILEKSWKASPHPEIADTYVRARIGDSVQDRLKRARKLEALKPNHLESLRIVARAALDAHDHDLARERAEAALRLQPREGLFLLLAEIEEADTGDQGRVRHWMGQAVRAQRDPAWTADGYVAEEWAPLSPVTGELDAFVWKVPVEQLGGPEIDARLAEQDAEVAIRSLPPLPREDPLPDAGQRADKSGTSEFSAGSSAAAKPGDDAAPRTETQKASSHGSAAHKAPETEAGTPTDSDVVSNEIADHENEKNEKAANRPTASATVIPLQQSEKVVDDAGSDTADTPTDATTDAEPAVTPDRKVEAAPPKAATGKRTSEPKTASDAGADGESEAREKEHQERRIDDPGVRADQAARSSGGSRFRLF